MDLDRKSTIGGYTLKKQGKTYRAFGIRLGITTEYLGRLGHCHILADSNVEISSHLVDVQMTVYPTGMEGGRTVIPVDK